MSDVVSPPKPVEPTWLLQPPAKPAVVSRVSRELSVPPLVASVLHARGLHDQTDSLKPAHALSNISTLPAAAARVKEAIEKGESILVHGDYDADGITGSAILQLGLGALGAKVRVYIPDRFENGYGINAEFVPQHAEGTDLFISVDCGITNIQEVELLKEAGVDVIITDHHTPKESLPDCLVVHPNLNPDTPPGSPQLTGAGVAYHLLWAVSELFGEEEPVEYSELAAIGTIADVVPLLGENRSIAKLGLARMLEGRWPGLEALISVALGDGRKGVTARDVAFMLAPRINASGRLGRADTALELLTTDDPITALELAQKLQAWNQERRDIQETIYEEALPLVEPDEPAIVLWNEKWHPGIIGIVASKLLELHWKPVFIAAEGGKGSVRSLPGVSALGALQHATEALRGFGGHVQAAGFTVEADDFPEFKRLINEYVAAQDVPAPEVDLDALLNPGDATPELWEALCELEPYGEGLRAPTFGLVAPLGRSRAVGQGGKHLQLHLGSLKGVSWGNGELATELKTGSVVAAAAALQENEWRGTKSIEFIASHVREHQPLAYPGVNGATPQRIKRGRGQGGISITNLGVDASRPLEAAAVVREAVASGEVVRFDLSETALRGAEEEARRIPGLPELRVAYKFIRAGRPAPLPAAALAFCEQVLKEVGLLDEAGKALPGNGTHPYASETLQTALAEQYRVMELIKAYRVVNDASFEQAVLTLFED